MRREVPRPPVLRMANSAPLLRLVFAKRRAKFQKGRIGEAPSEYASTACIYCCSVVSTGFSRLSDFMVMLGPIDRAWSKYCISFIPLLKRSHPNTIIVYHKAARRLPSPIQLPMLFTGKPAVTPVDAWYIPCETFVCDRESSVVAGISPLLGVLIKCSFSLPELLGFFRSETAYN
ncbi:hypothetical protein BJX61DRAFT_153735 [Aspergillus egyptiacus]|nr:hypothetical protein BJX61DRAFT_153735 [Aspergillus egyptiacus]